MSSDKFTPFLHRQRGFTLMEVLVSIIVLTIGILGAVGLQTFAFQNNREARLQATATKFAAEIADAMRANKPIASNTTATNNPFLLTFSSNPNTTPVYPNVVERCDTVACTTPASFSTWEMESILKRLNSELPYARVATCFDSAPYDATGKPRWACDGLGDFIAIKIGWGARDFAGGAVQTSQDDTVVPKLVFLSKAGT
jgi:type IV pilus assembly protein PilV